MLRHSKPMSSAMIKITLGFELSLCWGWQAMSINKIAVILKRTVLKKIFIGIPINLA